MSRPAIAPAVRGLVQGLVDYAGLFPPAALPMAEAVANYAQYHASRDAWALGRFVVPAARLGEFEQAAATCLPATATSPWGLSVLVGSPAELAAIEPFNDRWAGRIVIDAAEGKAASPGDVDRLAASLPARVALFVEVAIGPGLREVLAAVERAGASAKMRTGGLTPDAFPSPDDIVTFIRACQDAGVPFKATAGLHHPIRGAYRLTYAPDSPTGTMHGYLNVLVAAEAMAGGGSDADARRVLLAESTADLVVTDDAVTWAGIHAPRAVASPRQALLGIGSCSFREPVDELSALGVRS